jgi:Zn-dependent protease/predicted transcriptional regulator
VTPPRGWRIARVGGVPVHVRGSALVTLGVLWVVLYAQLAPSLAWRAGWLAPALTTLTCVAFLLSVVLHELAHALVARGLRLPVVAVTVFHLGGMTQLGRDPDDPRDEALVAAAGPVVNVLLAGVLLVAGITLGPRTLLGSTLIFLGYLNGTIGVFNLLPGHPLDGGALVRSAAWAATGDAVRSLRFSGVLGQALGGAMVLGGVLGALPGGPGASDPVWLWLAVVGGFVAVAARLGMIHADVRVRLSGMRARDLSRRTTFDVPAQTPVADVMARVTDASAAGLVLDAAGAPVGTLGADEVSAIPISSWDRVTVAESMQPLLGIVDAEEEVLAVLSRFRRTRDSALGVVADGRPVGILVASDVLAHLDRG